MKQKKKMVMAAVTALAYVSDCLAGDYLPNSDLVKSQALGSVPRADADVRFICPISSSEKCR